MDRHTRDKLYLTGMSSNGLLLERIKAVEAKERVLDGPPDKFRTYPVDLTKVTPFGVYRDYRTVYTQLYNMNEPEDGTILIGDAEECKCRYDILIAIRALTVCGVCKSTERATACRELLNAILSRREDGRLEKMDVAKSLKETGNYYKDELVRAIIDSVYTFPEQVRIKVMAAMKDKYVPGQEAIFDYGMTDMEEFDKKVNELYKRACMDPEYKVARTRGKLYNVIMHESKSR